MSDRKLHVIDSVKWNVHFVMQVEEGLIYLNHEDAETLRDRLSDFLEMHRSLILDVVDD